MHLQLILLVCLVKSSMTQSNDEYVDILHNTYGMPIQIPCDGNCGKPLILTPYIDRNETNNAKSAALVRPPIVPGIKSYSGFFTVNQQYNSNLWTLYVPATKKEVKQAPLIVILSSGPGIPFAYNLFLEFGPFKLNSNNEPEERQYSWAANHSLLYIACPVGTGYSFTDDDRGYSTNEAMVGVDLYSALQQFLTIFSELRYVPTFVHGELYSAKHCLELGYQIYKNRHKHDCINLQGFMIANGLVKPASLLYGEDYALQVGLITDKDAAKMKMYKKCGMTVLAQGKSLQALHLYNKAAAVFLRSTRLPNFVNFVKDYVPNFGKVAKFMQQSKIRSAFHVGSTEFDVIGKPYDKLRADIMRDLTYRLEEILKHYTAFFLNGMLSPLGPAHLAADYYRTLNFTAAEEFRNSDNKFWKYNGVVKATYRQVKNLLVVFLRSAGGHPAVDTPELVLDLATSFFANKTIS